MTVDVTTEITIARPRAAVATYVTEQGNAPEWYDNITSCEPLTGPPTRVGSQFTFVAHFLGRTMRYTYEISKLTPGERLTMRTADGPFPMTTTYEWHDAGDASTHMTLRNHGQPAGFARIVRPLMAVAMRRANNKDLRKLKAILER